MARRRGSQRNNGWPDFKVLGGVWGGEERYTHFGVPSSTDCAESCSSIL